VNDGKWSREEVAEKVDWEGGVSEAITDYGLSVDILPADTPPTIVEAWKRIKDTDNDVMRISHWLETGEAI
jgi:hypothetical protein